MDLRRSSDRVRYVGSFCLACLCVLAAGCKTVRPEDKELLADPAMAYGSGGETSAQEEHVLTNREGAQGAGQTVGGGCGCN